jgi:hypothetical protein
MRAIDKTPKGKDEFDDYIAGLSPLLVGGVGMGCSGDNTPDDVYFPTDMPVFPMDTSVFPMDTSVFTTGLSTDTPVSPVGPPAFPMSTISLDVPAIPLDAPAIPLDAPAISLDAPAIPLDAPAISLDAPAISLDEPTMLGSPAISLDEPTMLGSPASSTGMLTPYGGAFAMPPARSGPSCSLPLFEQQLLMMQKHTYETIHSLFHAHSTHTDSKIDRVVSKLERLQQNVAQLNAQVQHTGNRIFKGSQSQEETFVLDVIRSHCCDLEQGVQICQPYKEGGSLFICVSTHALKYVLKQSYDTTISLGRLSEILRRGDYFPGGNGRGNVANRVGAYCYYFGIAHFKSMVSIGRLRFIHIPFQRVLDNVTPDTFRPREIEVNKFVLSRRPFICASKAEPYNVQGPDRFLPNTGDVEGKLFSEMSRVVVQRELDACVPPTREEKGKLDRTLASLRASPGYLSYDMKFNQF